MSLKFFNSKTLNFSNFFFLIFIGVSFLISCTKKDKDQSILKLAIWGNYIPDEVLSDFEKEKNLKIYKTYYTSNEELLTKVQSGNHDIDIAVPSDYMVEVMIKMNLLEKINKEQIDHLSEVSKEVLNQYYDPSNSYSIPYAWSTTGIAYNTSKVTKEITSWKDFFERDDLKNKISVLDDARETIGIGLKIIHKNVNTTQKEDLNAVKEYFKKVKKNIKMFSSNTIDILKNEEVFAAHSFSTDALQAQYDSNGKIKYIVPEEGSTKAIDNLVIFKSSKNKRSALEFINYIAQPSTNLKIVSKIKTGPLFDSLKNQLPKELQENLSLFPTPELMTKLDKVIPLGDSTKLYENTWLDIKAF